MFFLCVSFNSSNYYIPIISVFDSFQKFFFNYNNSVRQISLLKGHHISFFFRKVSVTQFKIFQKGITYIFPLHSQKLVTYFGQISPNSTVLLIKGGANRKDWS